MRASVSAPQTAWRSMIARSSGSSAAGLDEDAVGHADLAEVVQLAGDRQVAEHVVADAEAPPTAHAQVDDLAGVARRVAVAQVQQ